MNGQKPQARRGRVFHGARCDARPRSAKRAPVAAWSLTAPSSAARSSAVCSTSSRRGGGSALTQRRGAARRRRGRRTTTVSWAARSPLGLMCAARESVLPSDARSAAERKEMTMLGITIVAARTVLPRYVKSSPNPSPATKATASDSAVSPLLPLAVCRLRAGQAFPAPCATSVMRRGDHQADRPRMRRDPPQPHGRDAPVEKRGGGKQGRRLTTPPCGTSDVRNVLLLITNDYPRAIIRRAVYFLRS